MNPITRNREKFASEHVQELKKQALQKIENKKTNMTWAFERLDDSPYGPWIDYHVNMYKKYGDEYMAQLGLGKGKTKELTKEIKKFESRSKKPSPKKVSPKKVSPSKVAIDCKACMMKGPGRRPAHTCGKVPVKKEKTKKIKKEKLQNIQNANMNKIIRIQARARGMKNRKRVMNLQPEKVPLIRSKSMPSIKSHYVKQYKSTRIRYAALALLEWAQRKFPGKIKTMNDEPFVFMKGSQIVLGKSNDSQTWDFINGYKFDESIKNSKSEHDLFGGTYQKKGDTRYCFVMLQFNWNKRSYPGSRTVTSSSHANALIFDLKDKTLTRYEPHGHTTTSYNSLKMDKKFKALLNKSKALKRYTYIGPHDLGVAHGPQAKALWSGMAVKDAVGRCLVWAMAFIYKRLNNPGWTPKQISRSFNKNPDELYMFESAFITLLNLKVVPMVS